MSSDNRQSYFLPEIRVGKIGLLKVHQISDDELNRLSQGAGQSMFLNLGIGILSVAISFLISLSTITITSNRLYYVFVIITVLGCLAGIVFLVLWWFTRKPISKLVKEIRERMPPKGEAQTLPTE